MKLLFNFFSSSALLLLLPSVVFANGEGSHAPGEEHDAATVDPLLLVGVVIAIVIGGFLLWRFVLHSSKSSLPNQSSPSEKTPPAEEKTVTQNDKSEVVS